MSDYKNSSESITAQAQLETRLRYLWQGELAGSLIIPVTAVLVAWAWDQTIGVLAIFGLGAVNFLLWQGAWYWWLRLSYMKSKKRLSARNIFGLP